MTLESGEMKFDLNVLGYQYPEVQHDDWDSNWLLIGIKVNTPDHSWSRVDPCLLTWESHWLLNWLADVNADVQDEPWMSFLESNLEFVVTSRPKASVAMKIVLREELRPPAARNTRDYVLKLLITSAQLREAVQDLTTELQRYPARAGVQRPCRPSRDSRNICSICRPAETA